MAEALVALAGLLVLGGAVAALRAVLDGRWTGTPASIAVLAPFAEGARLLSVRGTRAGAVPVLAGALLLASVLLRVLLLGVTPGLWLLGPDLVWWVAAVLLLGRRVLLPALAIEAPVVLALVGPVIGTRGDVPFAAEAPVALVLLLAIGGVLLPWAVEGTAARLGGGARLLSSAALAVQPVAVAATTAGLLLDVHGGVLLGATTLLTAVLVVAARRFPVLSLRNLARLSLAVLLPLAAVQLAIVLALSVL